MLLCDSACLHHTLTQQSSCKPPPPWQPSPSAGSLWKPYHCCLPPPTSLDTKYCSSNSDQQQQQWQQAGATVTAAAAAVAASRANRQQSSVTQLPNSVAHAYLHRPAQIPHRDDHIGFQRQAALGVLQQLLHHSQQVLCQHTHPPVASLADIHSTTAPDPISPPWSRNQPPQHYTCISPMPPLNPRSPPWPPHLAIAQEHPVAHNLEVWGGEVRDACTQDTGRRSLRGQDKYNHSH